MEKTKILEEIEKWKKIEETNNKNDPEILQINDSIKEIEHKMLKYLLEKYNSLELLETLKKKGIINNNGDLIYGNGISLTNNTLNFGFAGLSYYINPKSAMMLYGAYLEFSDGKINNNIRKELDYKNMSNSDLYNLNSYEIIYWCYINDITFAEFAKANFIHECSHRFGISGGEEPDDPYLFNVFAEGITELLAREFAKEKNMMYLPLFRNTELKFVQYFFENEKEELKNMILTWDNSYNVIVTVLFYLFNLVDNDDMSYEEKWLIIEKVLGETYQVKKERENNDTQIKSSDSFITIFDKLSIREDSEMIIEKVQEAIITQKNSKRK